MWGLKVASEKIVVEISDDVRVHVHHAGQDERRR